MATHFSLGLKVNACRNSSAEIIQYAAAYLLDNRKERMPHPVISYAILAPDLILKSHSPKHDIVRNSEAQFQ